MNEGNINRIRVYWKTHCLGQSPLPPPVSVDNREVQEQHIQEQSQLFSIVKLWMVKPQYRVPVLKTRPQTS